VLGEYQMTAGTGTERRWYDDGKPYLQRAMRGGSPYGELKLWDRDGVIAVTAKQYGARYDGAKTVGTKSTLRIEETFTNGTRHAARQIFQFWLLVIDENYDAKGKLDGAYTIWRDKKIPRVQGTYDHGKRAGTWSWFDRNNNKEREGDFVDGKKTGAWFEWTENKLTFSGTFTDGKPDGEFLSMDKNGTELGRFEIHDGTGTMETYYPNKKVASETHMVAGAMDGLYRELTLRGKVVVEGRYASDKKHGWWREWDDLGAAGLQLRLEQHWRWGKLDGAVKKYEGGKLISEATFKSGKADGPYTELRNGKPALTGTFANDRRIGVWTTYDPDGSVTLSATYTDGVLDGTWRQLASGSVVEGTMLAARRTGDWTHTDKTGAKQVVTYKAP
jgi:antitoxin component YwqK of YwqJK toxin-antitoxin module